QQFRALPGEALPKLEQQFAAGKTEADVYLTSDVGVMEALREKGFIEVYESPELDGYAPEYVSSPAGYWATYYINLGMIMYRSDMIAPAEAPKSFEDLLDPRWKGQIGFQGVAAGSQYAWWYVLKDVMPADYMDRLAAQEPRGYN